jgi:hypothetical protein
VFRTWRVADEYQLFGDLNACDHGLRHDKWRTIGMQP